MLASAVLAALWLATPAHALPETPASGEEAAEEESGAADDARVGLDLATQADRSGGHGLNGVVTYDLRPQTTLRVTADSVESRTSVATSQRAQGVEIGLGHEFTHWDIEAALGHWQDTDVVNARELKLAANLTDDPWSAGLRLGYRRSDFDPFTAQVQVKDAGGNLTPASASARCQIKNTAFGGDGRYDGEVWGGFVTAMSYRYGTAACLFEVDGIGAIHSSQPADAFRTLAAGLHLANLGARRIGRQETLLDSSLDAGLSYRHSDRTYLLEVAREKDFLSGATSTSLALTLSGDLGMDTAVDLTVGDTRGGGSVSTGIFAGFALRTRF